MKHFLFRYLWHLMSFTHAHTHTHTRTRTHTLFGSLKSIKFYNLIVLKFEKPYCDRLVLYEK